MRTPAPPPRALVVAAGVVLVAGVAITGIGGWRIGISVDEPYHVQRMTNYLHGSWFMLDEFLQNGQPAPWTDQQYVYGPVAMILLHAWSMLLGVDHPGQVSTTQTAYAVRHLGVGLLSLVGLGATAALGRLLLRSWGWGLVAAAALVAIPTWTGHAMFNVKDIPVAVGYTLTTLGLVVLVQAGRRRWLLVGSVIVLAGVVLAVGTRPGIAPGLGLSGAVALAVVVLRRQWGKALSLVVVGLAGVGALVAIYPVGFANPVRTLVRGATQSERFDGVQGPWEYVPRWLVIQVPELLLVLSAAGVLVGLLRIRWSPRPAERRRLDTETVTFVLVLLQTAALPVVAMLRHSNLYNGLRQLIFVMPGLALLATVAMAALWSRRGARAGRVRSGVAALVTAAALAVPMVAQAQLFPYSYAYSSVPVQFRTVAEQVHYLRGTNTDYWRISVRELAPRVPTGGFLICTPYVDASGDFLTYAGATRGDCADDYSSPLLPYLDDRRAPPVTDPTRFTAVATGSAYTGANCTRTAAVTRPLYWRTVTMSLVADCELVPSPYPDGGIVFGQQGQAGPYAIGNWESRVDESGIGLMDGIGQIAFGLPDVGPPSALRLVGTGADLTGLRVTVNGTVVAPRQLGATGFVLDVPASVAAAYGEGRVLLTVTGPTDLRIATLVVARLSGVLGAGG